MISFAPQSKRKTLDRIESRFHAFPSLNRSNGARPLCRKEKQGLWTRETVDVSFTPQWKEVASLIKISQTYFGTLPPAELSLAIGLKKCWSYVAFLQAVENFTLSLYASISDLDFGITLMHYYWVKSFSLVLFTWVMMLTELFATMHLAICSSIYYTFKTQLSFLCYVAVHYIILKAPSEKAQVLHQQRQHQKLCFYL